MPFPQLPSSEDIIDGFKGMVKMFAVLFVLFVIYCIYKEATTEKKPYVSPQDAFKECVKIKNQDVCLQEFEDRLSR